MALLDHSQVSKGAVAGEAAPLIRLPGAPAPKVGAAEWFTGAGGVRLRAALFPAPKPVGSVVISSGRTEFIEKYLEVAAELVARGFTVLIHDWRGQGLSQRLLPEPLMDMPPASPTSSPTTPPCSMPSKAGCPSPGSASATPWAAA